ncbi:MAG: hypothetical protein JNL42_12870, partial [Anaerolineae bacterium]|nr:hypothetical protein [Anaerolineae bacterium]
ALPGTLPDIPRVVTDDHRYLMARVMLDNIPLNDAAAGVAYMRSWAGSIGNPDNNLWAIQEIGGVQCTQDGAPIGGYADAFNNGSSEILRWFRGYMNCLRTGFPLEGELLDFDAKYSGIVRQINDAIADKLSGIPNPVAGSRYIKHTSSCFVWHRDSEGVYLTSCRGDGGRIDMQEFCAQQPNRPGIPTPTPAPPNRNCLASSINPSGVNVTEWLASPEGRASNQQLGLETAVGNHKVINLGIYIPDQPIPLPGGGYTSGQGCESTCFFLLGNPAVDSNTHLQIPISEESIQDAWSRHIATHNDPNYGYRGNANSYFAFVLRTEEGGAQTWITFVFQP